MVGLVEDVHLGVGNALVEFEAGVEALVGVAAPDDQSWNTDLVDVVPDVRAVEVVHLVGAGYPVLLPVLLPHVLRVEAVPAGGQLRQVVQVLFGDPVLVVEGGLGQLAEALPRGGDALLENHGAGLEHVLEVGQLAAAVHLHLLSVHLDDLPSLAGLRDARSGGAAAVDEHQLLDQVRPLDGDVGDDPATL